MMDFAPISLSTISLSNLVFEVLITYFLFIGGRELGKDYILAFSRIPGRAHLLCLSVLGLILFAWAYWIIGLINKYSALL